MTDSQPTIHSIDRRIVHRKVFNGPIREGISSATTIVYSFNRATGTLSYGATTFKKNNVHHVVTVEKTIDVKGESRVVRKNMRTGNCWNRKNHTVTASARHDNCPVRVNFAICLKPEMYLDTDMIEDYIFSNINVNGWQRSKSQPDVSYNCDLYPYREAILPGKVIAAIAENQKAVNNNNRNVVFAVI